LCITQREREREEIQNVRAVKGNAIKKLNLHKNTRWAGHVARMREGKGVYRVLIGRSEGKRPRGRPRRRWEDNIKLGLREIGIDGANWIQLAQNRVQWRDFVNTVMKGGYFLTG
jgi:hypothetical protein